MGERLKIGVLASTRGTNLQALIDDLEKDSGDYEIACVVSNVYDAGALDKARTSGIPAIFLDKGDKSREEYDKKLVDVMDKYGVKFVCLIGYMKIITPVFIDRYKNKIINVHPSLIPSFCGPGYYGDVVHESVLDEGCKVSGMTIHIVDEEVDAGEIVCQKCCEIEDGETIESLRGKVQALEKEWYPKVVREYAKKGHF